MSASAATSKEQPPSAATNSGLTKVPAAPSLADRFCGCILGMACGDAVGTTVEFMPPGSFSKVTDMTGGGKFSLLKGQWTDDTSMAMCLAESLLACGAHDAADQMRRYYRWYSDAHWSSNGQCFDIGKQTRTAVLAAHAKPANPYPASADAKAAGNGSLMRLAPVPLFYWQSPEVAMDMASDSSRTTHGPTAARDACRYYSALIIGALHGASKAELLGLGTTAKLYVPPGLPADWWDSKDHALCKEVSDAARGSYRQAGKVVRSGGYVVDALEAALWAFDRSTTFEDGCLLAVNLGDDADTIAAIYGQLAGAHYGVQSIPAGWREAVSFGHQLSLVADELLRMAPLAGQSKSALTPSQLYRSLSAVHLTLEEYYVGHLKRYALPGPKRYKAVSELDAHASELRAMAGRVKLLDNAPPPALAEDDKSALTTAASAEITTACNKSAEPATFTAATSSPSPASKAPSAVPSAPSSQLSAAFEAGVAALVREFDRLIERDRTELHWRLQRDAPAPAVPLPAGPAKK